MPTVHERVGQLEGRMQDQSVAISELKDGLARLDAKMDAGFARLDDKMSRQFVWLVGMLVTMLAAIVGGLLSRNL